MMSRSSGRALCSVRAAAAPIPSEAPVMTMVRGVAVCGVEVCGVGLFRAELFGAGLFGAGLWRAGLWRLELFGAGFSVGIR